jgi:large subunit ribosomal protein L9
MDIILLENVENLGQVGQRVAVARGYARNYLIPRGLAMLASESSDKVLADLMRRRQMDEDRRRTEAEGLAQRLQGAACTIEVQAGEDDQLYGSVTARQVGEALAKQGIELEIRQILLAEPIKQLGVYTVPVRLHPEVEVDVKVWVVRT